MLTFAEIVSLSLVPGLESKIMCQYKAEVNSKFENLEACRNLQL